MLLRLRDQNPYVAHELGVAWSEQDGTIATLAPFASVPVLPCCGGATLGCMTLFAALSHLHSRRAICVLIPEVRVHACNEWE